VIRDHLTGAHMVFVTAGMGGGTGTGAAPIIAKTARELGVLTIGVVTKPFHFEGQRRMRFAEAGIAELLKVVDTLLIIPNQNLFRVANEKTTFADAFSRRIADRIERSAPLPQLESPPLRPTVRHPEGRPAKPISENARHAAPQGLDPYGRSSPVRNSIQENVLDIPAFLRRKAN
jgi:cell division protein FtsZ